MENSLDGLDPSSAQTITKFQRYCADQVWDGIGELFSVDATFEGPLVGGTLRGRRVIESHFRQVFRRVESKDAFQPQGVEISGRKVTIHWGSSKSEESGQEPLHGQTLLELDEEGLILKAQVKWKPKLFLNQE